MKNVLKKTLTLGLGLAVVTKEQVENLVDELVKKGEVSTAESKNLVSEILQKGHEQQQELNSKIRTQIKELLNDLHLASKEDLEDLKRRIKDLENKE